jgi:hypothetical protein
MNVTYICLLPLIVLYDCCTLGATAVLLILLDRLVRKSPSDIEHVHTRNQQTAASRCRRDLLVEGANSSGAIMPLFAPPSVERKPLLPAELSAEKRKILVTGATGYIGGSASAWCLADKARSDSCYAGLAAADSYPTPLGFAGSRVVERLLAAGHTVHVLARPRSKPDPEDMLLYLKVCQTTCCLPQQPHRHTSSIDNTKEHHLTNEKFIKRIRCTSIFCNSQTACLRAEVPFV